MDLEELKLYIRVDNDEDNALVQSLQLCAEEYLQKQCGIAKNYNSSLYSLAVKLLANHWYENREVVVIGSISKNLEYSLNSILFALKYGGGSIG